MMDLDQIRGHWTDWATRYAADLRSTTKTRTIKQLEIDAFARAIRRLLPSPVTALEVGCGNLVNTLSLARLFPGLSWTASDYLPEMVANSLANRDREQDLAHRVHVTQADIRFADQIPGSPFDLVISDRVIINLNTWDLQREALDALVRATKPGGHVLLAENVMDTFAAQNGLRRAVGLPARLVADFNFFLDDQQLLEHLAKTCDLLAVDDFGALHDLVLYVLTPIANGGQVDYDHPLVKAATELSLGLRERVVIGPYGQNRLYVYKRR
jgi:SAM-dependent methyltransferase